MKDNLYRTPMLCAAEKYHKDIVQLLSPARAADRLSPSARGACEQFEATVVDFGEFRDKKPIMHYKHSVFDVLYGWEDGKPEVPTVTKNIKHQPAFRWIHLPANNIAWVEVLISKHFIETGHRDIDSFKTLERCFEQEHRGPLPHAHFMRTYTQRITGSRRQNLDRDEKDKLPVLLSEGLSDASTIKPTQSDIAAASIRTADTAVALGSRPEKKKGKGELIAERNPQRAKRTKGSPGNPPGSKEAKIAIKKQMDLQRETSKLPASNSRLVLFMPFLHFETNARRERMSKEVERAKKPHTPPEKPTRDMLLIHGYLKNNPPLHLRRTLDQFYYHGIDTASRDTDQVVYRYCKKVQDEPKVFMVDQLWLWVFGRDLIITCFPQRWDQPKQDPLNVVDGIIEEINAKTRPPIQSVYDLSVLITSRCSGMFDRHRLEKQEFQFLDMFESSIGAVTDEESSLFSQFNKASERFAQQLRRQRLPRRRRARDRSRSRGNGNMDETHDHNESPDDAFPDNLLNISQETSLLAEIKDIRDELNILTHILKSQEGVLEGFIELLEEELRAAITTSGKGAPSATATANASSLSLPHLISNDPSGGGGGIVNKRTIELFISEIKKRAGEQQRCLEVHIKDLERMDRQADQIYNGLAHLLDLKQKHSNALEARFARDQAVIAARQGQTVMVFTIVTIVFLPMSFIAAFFAINFQEWQDRPLTLAYVSKYMFGIGLGISIPLVAMAFTVTDIYASAAGLVRQVQGLWRTVGRRGRKVDGKDQNKKSWEGDGDEGDDEKAPRRYHRESEWAPRVSGLGRISGLGYRSSYQYPREDYGAFRRSVQGERSTYVREEVV